MRARAKKMLVCALLGACTVTNTGNPSMDPPGPGGGDPPDGLAPSEGLAFLRSELEREQTPGVSGEEQQDFGSQQRAFAGAMYGQLGASEGNLFFSPYSIASALAMTYAGARGETKREMAEALRFELGEPKLHAAFNAADLALAKRASAPIPNAQGDGFALASDNGIFARAGLDVQKDFLDLLALNYGAGLFVADFAQAPERERQAINAWVYERTEQRIEELLPEGSIDALTQLVLCNTIYFKGSWLKKFDPKDTVQAPFHAVGGDVNVPMMRATTTAGMARGGDYVAAELPYLSDAVRMLLVLPSEGQLAAVEERVASGLFDEVRGALTMRSFEVGLPRFSFRSEHELPQAFKALGMERAFSDAADFSGIAGMPGQIYIDNIYHQAFVAVDEQGTEAAASTVVVATTRSLAASVTFDRPFLFFIHDEPTGQILFAGRFSRPE